MADLKTSIIVRAVDKMTAQWEDQWRKALDTAAKLGPRRLGVIRRTVDRLMARADSRFEASSQRFVGKNQSLNQVHQRFEHERQHVEHEHEHTQADQEAQRRQSQPNVPLDADDRVEDDADDEPAQDQQATLEKIIDLLADPGEHVEILAWQT